MWGVWTSQRPDQAHDRAEWDDQINSSPADKRTLNTWPHRWRAANMIDRMVEGAHRSRVCCASKPDRRSSILLDGGRRYVTGRTQASVRDYLVLYVL